MRELSLEGFREIWSVDFEFLSSPGELPIPVCVVAWEFLSRRKLRFWKDDLRDMTEPPYALDKDCLFVSYYSSAEIGCHLALGWSLPENNLDLYPEFRNLTNEKRLPCGKGLVGALAWFGLNGIGTLQKENMRDLILRGPPWTSEERSMILEYCESDVATLVQLLRKMAPLLDLPRALLRGRYMKAVARIEQTGTPIDVASLRLFQKHWDEIKMALISRIDSNYGVYDEQTFKAERFRKWLIKNGIPWPHLDSGNLDLKDETFKERARVYPQINSLRELRVALSRLRLADLAVGKDGRNRCMLSAFQTKTGRNAPSNSKFIFGPAVWLRSLIKPACGHGLAYIDWSQQEFGIAAALSRDQLMMDAYRSGDSYLEFAKQAGAVPPDATKESHPREREQFKACVLGVNYGMGEQALARRIGQPAIVARDLLRLHRQTYKSFWRWSDGALDYAKLYGKIQTTFGWSIHTNASSNSRMLRNFPVQANGSEMLRLACSLVTEKEIKICAPVHDALLIEAPLKDLDYAIEITRRSMAKASAIVLEGFKLQTDVKVVRYPERYMDPRGVEMWKMVWDILQHLGIDRTPSI